jgi:hypothetical protein
VGAVLAMDFGQLRDDSGEEGFSDALRVTPVPPTLSMPLFAIASASI